MPGLSKVDKVEVSKVFKGDNITRNNHSLLFCYVYDAPTKEWYWPYQDAEDVTIILLSIVLKNFCIIKFVFAFKVIKNNFGVGSATAGVAIASSAIGGGSL